jgi:hypothetical protein
MAVYFHHSFLLYPRQFIIHSIIRSLDAAEAELLTWSLNRLAAPRAFQFSCAKCSRLKLEQSCSLRRIRWLTVEAKSCGGIKEFSFTLEPITVAELSNAWTVFVRLNTGIVGSNPTRGMDVCVRLFCVCVVLRVGSGLATGWSLVQEIQPTVYRLRNWKNGQGQKGCRAIERERVLPLAVQFRCHVCS